MRKAVLKSISHLEGVSSFRQDFFPKLAIGYVVFLVEDFIGRIEDDSNAVFFDEGFVVEPVEDVPQSIAQH